MGFRLNRTYVLKFEGAMEGAEVKLRSTSVSTALELRAGQEIERTAQMLVDHVIDWNLEDAKGVKLDFTAQALLDELEEPVLAAIIKEWFKAAVGITSPLDAPSTSGEPSPEESIPMEML
jgi:hypothetical protein